MSQEDRTRFMVKAEKEGVLKDSIGLNRTVEGDKGIVLYFGLWDDGPKYASYSESEVVCID